MVTGLPVVQCIAILGAFAAAWAWMGGITTVIWTDVVQYVLFLGGAVFALAWVLGAVPGGVAEVLRVADDHAKLRLLDLSLDPTKTFTLWAGLVGSSIFSLGQSSIDQVSTQRLMCCANIREAKKAMYGALFISVPTYLMLFVGLGLFAFYHHQPLPPDVAARFVEQPDRVYPYFIVSELPVGVSGLLIAAIFAAGISTLDSALAALSETTLTGAYRRLVRRDASDAHYLRVSRVLVLLWAVVLCGLAAVLAGHQETGLLKLGLAVPGYSFGALLAIASLAVWGRGTFGPILLGTLLSIAVVILAGRLADVAFFWWYPIGAGVVLICVLPFARRPA